MEKEISMPGMYQKTYPISWEQLHRDSKALAWRLVDQQTWKGIVAITRGGLVPAAIVARELDIHLVDTWILFPWDSESQFIKPIAGRVSRDTE